MNPYEEFSRTGRVWFRHALSSSEISDLLPYLLNDERPGERPAWSLLKLPIFEENGPIDANTGGLLRCMKPVRLVSFNKQSGSNWAVPWHQDRVIAVKDKVSSGTFSNWTRQKDYWHCEPPIKTFEDMVVVRIHLDDCTESSGSMQLALKSHGLGLVPADMAVKVAATCEIDDGTAAAGDILVFHPLLLHRSQKATQPNQRRVLRIDFAPKHLETGLKWAADHF